MLSLAFVFETVLKYPMTFYFCFASVVSELSFTPSPDTLLRWRFLTFQNGRKSIMIRVVRVPACPVVRVIEQLPDIHERLPNLAKSNDPINDVT
jgi:hypothetical protein